ncbi:MAG: PQQ-binding-like beta-propeller repeat protein [Gemmataceae bacterium]|nr:PQQ-binding-like beta-propeller repeat protein [Gemmataceae bacterium]
MTLTGPEAFDPDVAPDVLMFSPDGKQLLVGGSALPENRLAPHLSVFDVGTRKRTVRLAGHSACVRDVAFSQDGKLMASCGDDNEVRLWDTQKWELVRRITHQEGGDQLLSVAVSPDGSLVIAGSNSSFVVAFDAATGRQLWTLDLPKPWNRGQMVVGLRFAQGGRLFVAGTDSGRVFVCGIDKGKAKIVKNWSVFPEDSNLQDGIPELERIDLSPKGDLVAVAAYLSEAAPRKEGYGLSLWEVATGERIADLGGHRTGTFAVAFFPDGDLLVSGGKAAEGEKAAGELKVWSVRQKRLLAVQQTLKKYRVWALAVSPDGSRLAVGNPFEPLVMWRIDTDSGMKK